MQHRKLIMVNCICILTENERKISNMSRHQLGLTIKRLSMQSPVGSNELSLNRLQFIEQFEIKLCKNAEWKYIMEKAMKKLSKNYFKKTK